MSRQREVFDPAPGIAWLESNGFVRLGASRNAAWGDGSRYEAKATSFAWTAYRSGGIGVQAAAPELALRGAGWTPPERGL